jgi:hypothetical protein
LVEVTLGWERKKNRREHQKEENNKSREMGEIINK